MIIFATNQFGNKLINHFVRKPQPYWGFYAERQQMRRIIYQNSSRNTKEASS